MVDGGIGVPLRGGGSWLEHIVFLVCRVLPGPPFSYFLFPNVYSDLPKGYEIVHLCRKDRQRVSIKCGGNLHSGLSGTWEDLVAHDSFCSRQ